MGVWEIVILMVVAALCISCGIGFVYSSIVNTIEQYQIHKAERNTKAITSIFKELQTLTGDLLKKFKEDEEKRKREFEKNFRKELEKDE